MILKLKNILNICLQLDELILFSKLDRLYTVYSHDYFIPCIIRLMQLSICNHRDQHTMEKSAT